MVTSPPATTSTASRTMSPPRPADLSAIIQRIEDRRQQSSQLLTSLNITMTPVVHGGGGSGLNQSVHRSPTRSPGRNNSGYVQPHVDTSNALATQPLLPSSSSGVRLAVPSNTSTPAVSATTELSLLRLELQQRTSELDMKRRTITKLESDTVRLLAELDELRRTEADKRDATHRQHREELRKQRDATEELQRKINEEIALRGQSERAALSVGTLTTRISGLEEQLRVKQSLLTDRERDLESVVIARRELDAKIVAMEKADMSNVLRGRLSVVEERLASANEQLSGLQNSLTAQERKRDEVEADLKKALEVVQERDAGIATLTALLTQKEEANNRLAAEMERVTERMETTSARHVQSEAQHAQEQLALQGALDDQRAEVRRRQQQIYHLETQVAELQEHNKTSQISYDSLSETVLITQGELQATLERLRASNAAIEEREAELAKMNTVHHEQRGQVLHLKAQLDAVTREVDTTSAAAREARAQVGELTLSLAHKATAEERLLLARKAQSGLESDLADEQRITSQLRERLGTLEQQLASAREDVGKLRDVQRLVAVRDETIASLQGDAKVHELREAAWKEDLSTAREKLHVADTRWRVELERREELERKLRLLEDANQAAMGIYGRYAALQQFLSTTTSEASKSMELNNALLDEVKTLEVLNRDWQGRFDRLLDEKTLLAAQAAEAVMYKSDLERALTRARDAEAREHELRLSRRSDPLEHRIRELEDSVVNAVRRANSAEGELQQLQNALADAASSAQHTAAQGQQGPGVGGDGDVSSASSGQEEYQQATPSSLMHHPTPPVPLPTPAPLQQAEPTVTGGSDADKDEITLKTQLLEQQQRISEQDRRLEQLTQQFSNAMAELTNLRTTTTTSSTHLHHSGDYRELSSPRHSVSNLSPVSAVSKSHSAERHVTGAHLSVVHRTTHEARDELMPNLTPFILAQRQQRVRGPSSPVDLPRGPIPPQQVRLGSQSPLRSPSRAGSGSLAGTPPRVVSPKTVRIQQQRAALSDSVREKMSLLFHNAREVSLASPSPARKAGGGGYNARHASPPVPQHNQNSSTRRMTSVFSPTR